METDCLAELEPNAKEGNEKGVKSKSLNFKRVRADQKMNVHSN
jgi:hypothetical protein